MASGTRSRVTAFGLGLQQDIPKKSRTRTSHDHSHDDYGRIEAMRSIGICDHGEKLTMKFDGKEFDTVNPGSTCDELLSRLGNFNQKLTNAVNASKHEYMHEALCEALISCKIVSQKSMDEESRQDKKSYCHTTYGACPIGHHCHSYHMVILKKCVYVTIQQLSPGIRVSDAIVFSVPDYETFVMYCDCFPGIFARCDDGKEFQIYGRESERTSEIPNLIDLSFVSQVGNNIVHSQHGKMEFFYGTAM